MRRYFKPYSILPKSDPRPDIEQLFKKLDSFANEFPDLNKQKLLPFFDIHHNFQLTVELLDGYYKEWASNKAMLEENQVELAIKENGDRVIMITKWSFVASVSLIEFVIKKLITDTDGIKTKNWKEKLQTDKETHLSQILTSQKDKEQLNISEFHDWETVLHVRNIMTHNNAIAYHTKNLKIDDFEIKMIEGKILQGQINFFVTMTDKLIELFRKWLLQFIVES